MSQIEQKTNVIEELKHLDEHQILVPYDPLLINEIDKVEQVVENAVDQLVDVPMGLWLARGLLLLEAILCGTNFASVKYLENLCFEPPCHHLPSEFAFARFGVAALASSPFLFNQNLDVIKGGLECGLFVSLGYLTQALALSYISAGQCAFICSLTVVVVPLLSFVLYRKPITMSNIISGILALAGVAVLEGLVNFVTEPAVATAVIDAGSAVSGDIWQEYKGDLLALGQPIGFGLAFMKIEENVEKFKHVPNRVLTISAAQCLVTGFISYLWVLYDYHGVFPNLSYMIEIHHIGAIAWTGIMTTVVAIYLECVALQVASATEASLLFSSEPVWASLFGLWLLHEQLGINAYVGGAIILCACILSATSDLTFAKPANDEQ